MKKSVCLGLFLLLAMAVNANAAVISDPAGLAAAGHFQLGLEAVYQSRVKYDDSTADASRSISDGSRLAYQYAVTDLVVEEDQYYFLTLSYGLLDRLNLFAKAGVVRGGKKSSGSVPDRYYDLREDFAWAVGGKLRLLQTANGMSLLLAGQYLRFDGRRQAPTWDIGQARDFKMDNWRADLEMVGAWRLGAFTPYLGAKYSYSEVKIYGDVTSIRDGLTWVTHSEYTAHNRDQFGGLAGLAWDIGHGLRLNLQGDYLSDLTVSLSLTYRFQAP